MAILEEVTEDEILPEETAIPAAPAAPPASIRDILAQLKPPPDVLSIGRTGSACKLESPLVSGLDNPCHLLTPQSIFSCGRDREVQKKEPFSSSTITQPHFFGTKGRGSRRESGFYPIGEGREKRCAFNTGKIGRRRSMDGDCRIEGNARYVMTGLFVIAHGFAEIFSSSNRDPLPPFSLLPLRLSLFHHPSSSSNTHSLLPPPSTLPSSPLLVPNNLTSTTQTSRRI